MDDDLEEGEVDVDDISAEEQAAKLRIKASIGATTSGPALRVPSPPSSPLGAREDGTSGRKLSNKEKKRLQKAQRRAERQTSGFKDIYGPEARASVHPQKHKKKTLRIVDVQQLLLWMLEDGVSPEWVFVKNKPLVRQVVVLAVPGISAHLFKQHEEALPSFRALGKPVQIHAEQDKVRPMHTLNKLFTVPFRQPQQTLMQELHAGLASPMQANGSSDKKQECPFPASHYALRLKDLELHEYPLPAADASGALCSPDGFLATRPNPEGADEERMVACDCEMCETSEGLELTRVSLVDETGKVLVDELVRPPNPITDYLTQHSGITPAMMEGITTTLADVQTRFLELVSASTLLVGHALQNDLRQLRIVHTRVIDTAVIYPHPKGGTWKSALRFLAERHLKRRIQDGSHDSVIDARTAMDLTLLKIRRGPAYGVTSHEERGDRLLDRLSQAGCACTMVDRPDFINRQLTGTASAMVCGSDEEVAEKLAKAAAVPGGEGTPQGQGRPRFVWAQLRQLAQIYEERYAAHRRSQGLARGAAGGTSQQHAGSKRTHVDVDAPSSDPADDPSEDGGIVEPPAKRRAVERSPGVSPAAVAVQDGTAGPMQMNGGTGRGVKGSHGAGRAEAGQTNGPRASAADGEEGLAAADSAEEGEVGESDEVGALLRLDALVGRVWAALPPNTLLLAPTCQGDTAATRRLQESKIRRQARLEEPPWDSASEVAFNLARARNQQALCFVAIKP